MHKKKKTNPSRFHPATRPGSDALPGRPPPPTRPGPDGGKRAENRRRRVEALCEAGLELFLARGIEAVSIDDIAAAARLSKAGFYRYFRDKTELCEAILAPIAGPAKLALSTCGRAIERATTDEELRQSYADLGLSLAAIVFAEPERTQLYLAEGRAPVGGARGPVRALAEDLADAAVDLSEAALAAGLLAGVPAPVSALVVLGAVERLLFEVLAGTRIEDPSALADQLASLVLDGLAIGRGSVGATDDAT